MVTKPTIGQDPYGVDLNAALDQLEADRIAGDAALDGRLDVAESTISALPATYVSKANTVLNLRDLVTPSGTDDTAGVNAALATLDAAGGGVLFIPKDNWVFAGSTSVELINTVNPIHIVAEEGTVWDMRSSTATYGLHLGGSVGTAVALGADATRGSDSITCGLSVAAGDIIKIVSSDVYAPNLVTSVKGELAEVLSVSGGVISLKSSLWDSYTAATTTVAKVTAPKLSVKNLTILRNSNHMGVLVENARDVVLENLYAEGARERLFFLNQCFGGTVENIRGRDFWYSGTGTSYGLCIASSQHIVERDNDLRGGRHAVTHGGTFPCRDIKMYGGVYDNYGPSNSYSVDFHENTDTVYMNGVTALNSVWSGAGNFLGENLIIRTKSNQRAAIFYITHSSEYIRLLDSDVQGQHDLVWVAAYTGAVASTVGLVEITGHIHGLNQGAGVHLGIKFEPHASTETATTIDRIKIDADVKSQRGINLTSVSGASIAVGSLEIAGRVVGTTDYAFVQNVAAGFLDIHDAELITNGSGFSSYSGASAGATDVTITDSRLAAVGVTGSYNAFGTGRVALVNLSVENFNANGGILANTASEAFVAGVRPLNCTGNVSLPARHFFIRNAAGKVVTYGSAAPSAGTWAVGDRCVNTAPAINATKSWVCTSAGTPGTWTAEEKVGNDIYARTVSGAADGSALIAESTAATAGGQQVTLRAKPGGYGAGLRFESTETGTSTVLPQAAITADGEGNWASVANADSYLAFRTAVDGVLGEAARFKSDGTFKPVDGKNIEIGTGTGTKIGTGTTQKIGFWNAAPVVRPSAYTQTYSTADKTLNAYTTNAQSSAYTGAADSEAKLADLNALRVAYENLRASHDDLMAFVNSIVDDLQAIGLVG